MAARAALTRQRLVAAARKVFLRRRFHASSLEEIALEAGVTKGAVYSNFASKSDLFLAIFDRHVEERLGARTRRTWRSRRSKASKVEPESTPA